MKLSKADKNSRFIVQNIDKSNKILYERLTSFGVYEGEILEVIDFSYFKNNIKIKVKNALIALRIEEADGIEVELC